MGSTSINLFRFASVEATDKALRTVSLSFSSENPVRRSDPKYGGDYLEVLSHDEDDVDLYRLQVGGPVLLDHDVKKQIGAVQSVEIRNGKGFAMVKFSTSELATQIWDDVCAGIRSNCSVGYNVDEVVGESVLNGERCLRFAWAPYEISIVSVPADPGVGIGRSQQIEVTKPAPLTQKELKEIREQATREIELERKKKNMETVSIEQAEQAQTRRFEFPAKDRERYSLSRAIEILAKRKQPDGIEGEMSQELFRHMRSFAGGNFIIPSEILCEPRRRDSTVGNFSSAGAFVQTSVPGIENWIELLRNRTIFEAMGARTIHGATSNILLPRQTGSTAQKFSGEQQNSTVGTPSIDGILLAPKKCSATTNLSMTLLRQCPSADEFCRRDLMDSINQKVDFACLQGDGGQEILGLLNTTGVGSIQYGGTPTWTQITAQDQALASANVYGRKGKDSYAVVLGSKSFSRWATIPKVGTTGAASPNFILEKVTPEFGFVNGFPAIASTQVQNELSYMGCMSDCLLVFFGGFELIPDFYTAAEEGTAIFTVLAWADFALTVPQSWEISVDPANQ